jgi:hypothetical protein
MAAAKRKENSTPAESTSATEKSAHAPIDGEALRKALSGADTAGAGPASYVQKLQERAEAALSGYDTELSVDIDHPWSLRRQFLFIAVASALTWAAVLTPLILIF